MAGRGKPPDLCQLNDISVVLLLAGNTARSTGSDDCCSTHVVCDELAWVDAWRSGNVLSDVCMPPGLLHDCGCLGLSEQICMCSGVSAVE